MASTGATLGRGSVGTHPWLKTAGVVGGSIVGGIILNKLINPGVKSAPRTTLLAPTDPAPPKLAVAPDTGSYSGSGRKSGRNATILTGSAGLGSVDSSNLQTKTLLGT